MDSIILFLTGLEPSVSILIGELHFSQCLYPCQLLTPLNFSLRAKTLLVGPTEFCLVFVESLLACQSAHASLK